MSIEELLVPRYKQINDWPFMTHPFYAKGKIFTLSLPEQWDGWDMDTLLTHQDIMPKFPHLFKPLEWWEERQLNEMPRYLRFRTNGLVRKVAMYHLGIDQIVFEGGRTRRLTKDWIPVTEEQFNSQPK